MAKPLPSSQQPRPTLPPSLRKELAAKGVVTVPIQEIGLPKSYSSRDFVASFKVDPELWTRFKEICASRGVSICHVLEALMEAWIQGQKVEATIIRPVVVNLTMQHVVQRPRRVTTHIGAEQIHCSVYECRMEATVFLEKPGSEGRVMYAHSCLDHRPYFERRQWRVTGS